VNDPYLSIIDWLNIQSLHSSQESAFLVCFGRRGKSEELRSDYPQYEQQVKRDSGLWKANAIILFLFFLFKGVVSKKNR
jgi:hypothetical protein